MGNNYFQFKLFKIIQEKSAMKVGIDAALLGAWADTEKVNSILDVGTGTGIIALMLAQRSMAKTDAVEIEKNAADEAKQNVENSPWATQIKVHHTSFQQYADRTRNSYDLIVSNPPFFSHSARPPEKGRALARHSDSLTHEDLLTISVKLLSPQGKLSLVLPVDTAERFEKMAKSHNVVLNRLTIVYPTPKKAAHRLLMEFSRTKKELVTSELYVHRGDRMDYSEQYKELLKDFYLLF